MTFKAGDKVYNYRFGIVELFESGHQVYPLKVLGRSSHTRYHFDGKITSTDKHPSLIPLEKAEKMGLVRKRVKPHKGLRVKYRDTRDNSIHISAMEYEGFWDFVESRWEPESSQFMYFVDEQGNKWVRPEKTFVWSEV